MSSVLVEGNKVGTLVRGESSGDDVTSKKSMSASKLRKRSSTIASKGDKRTDGEDSSIYAVELEDLQFRCCELEAEQDMCLENLKKTLEEMSKIAKGRKNMDSSIKLGLEKAVDELQQVSRTRRALKLSQNRLQAKQEERVPSVSAPHTKGIQVLAVDIVPGSNMNKERQVPGTSSLGSVQEAKSVEKHLGESSADLSLAEEIRRDKPVSLRKHQVDQREAEETETLKQADGKKRRPRRNRRKRPEAVLIKPTQGTSYADVLKSIRSQVNPDEMGVKVKAVRQTRAGDILVELRATSEAKAIFGTAVRGAIGRSGEVRSLVPKAQVDIGDIDSATDEAEVKAALDFFFGEAGDYKINLSRVNRWGNIKAFVEMEESKAVKLDQAGHIRVGWINCRARRRVKVIRCFRCHGYGHISKDCTGADRSEACWKCGQRGHRARNCSGKPKCYLCAEKCSDSGVEHLPGSMRCKVYLDAGAKVGTKWR